MQGNIGERSSGLWSRGAAALAAMLVLVASVSAFPAEAAPFAYVANTTSKHFQLINTATNIVVKTQRAGSAPFGVAVAPDGRFVYLTNPLSNTVSVVRPDGSGTIATIPVGSFPLGGGPERG